MITDLIFKFLFAVPQLLIERIPVIDFDIPPNLSDGITNCLSCIGWVMPMDGLMPILVISGALETLHIAIAIIVRIKSFIPTMGA